MSCSDDYCYFFLVPIYGHYFETIRKIKLMRRTLSFSSSYIFHLHFHSLRFFMFFHFFFTEALERKDDTPNDKLLISLEKQLNIEMKVKNGAENMIQSISGAHHGRDKKLLAEAQQMLADSKAKIEFLKLRILKVRRNGQSSKVSNKWKRRKTTHCTKRKAIDENSLSN